MSGPSCMHYMAKFRALRAQSAVCENRTAYNLPHLRVHHTSHESVISTPRGRCPRGAVIKRGRGTILQDPSHGDAPQAVAPSPSERCITDLRPHRARAKGQRRRERHLHSRRPAGPHNRSGGEAFLLVKAERHVVAHSAEAPPLWVEGHAPHLLRVRVRVPRVAVRVAGYPPFLLTQP